MDWDKLRVFHAVADAGSLTHAARALNLSQSAISRQISKLEESLQVALFHRHARGLKLTEQGELLLRTAQDVIAKLSMAEARIAENRERPEGPLKITTTVAFGSVWLTSRIKEFIALYPSVEVSLALADTELDLSMREADAAIRMQPPTQPDLIQRPLMRLHYHLYASSGYIKEMGMPKIGRDLDEHRLVVYGKDANPPVADLNWIIDFEAYGIRRSPVLKVNSIYGIFRAVQSGLGIAALPDYMSRESENLVRVLPEVDGPSVDAFFVYPEELRKSKRINILRDFLISKVRGETF